MSFAHVWTVLRKDFAIGPRSPFFLYTIILPVALTLILQVTFGSLFAPHPRMGIVDEGSSAITAAIRATEGIDVTMLGDAEELKRLVEGNDLDAGLILPVGFDKALRGGEQPLLQFFVGGQSHAANRIVLSVTALDAVRGVEGGPTPVDVRIVTFGDKGLPMSIRLVPVIVFYALVMAGVFLPGSSLVEEKETGTLAAMLVTPLRMREILLAKWTFGVVLATVMSVATLLLNGALGSRPIEVFLVVLMAAGLSAMIGLLVGVVSKDSTMLFGLIKGAGIVLFAPVLFYLFPAWPQWIAKLFPLYWVIEPIWRVSIMGESITTVWFEMGVALAITVALVPVTLTLARRMQTHAANR